MEITNNYHQYGLIPVYIDYSHIGNKDIESLIRDYLGLSSTQAKDLINNKKILLLIDNYNPTVESQYVANNIYKFSHKFDARIIATCNTEIPGSIPISFSDSPNKLAFEYYHIWPFKSANIRELMRKWSPQNDFGKRTESMDKLVNSFTSYCLPCTPMSVSLYLWSRNEKHREPINKAVLVDIYISIILDRLDPNNVYQNTFDYRNRIMLISHIAYQINKKEELSLEYDEYVSCISNYLRKVGFDRFSPDRLGNYYIERKIFNRCGNKITFAHSCFFHYFLAQRMMDDRGFREEILKSDNFYHYEQTIDYYGGLMRNDVELMQFVHNELIDMFKPVQEVANKVDYDVMFTNIVERSTPYKPYADGISVNKIHDKKPKEEEVEKKLDTIHDKELERISDNLNKNVRKSPSLLILTMATALRNLDGVEDYSLKLASYNDLIKDALLYTAITKNNLAICANKHNGKLPGILEVIRDVERFLRFMPFSMQFSLGEIIGTTKLNSVFRDKLRQDYKLKTSDVEKYMTLGMLWDASNLENEKDAERFIKNTKKNSSIDYILLKLLYYYNTRVKADSDEAKAYEKLFASIQARGYALPYLKKYKLLKGIESKRSK